MIQAAPPPPPALTAPAVSFGSATVRIGPRTTRVALVVDGSRRPWRRVRSGPRRLDVSLPRGRHVIRVVAAGAGGSRRSRAMSVLVLPRSARRVGRVPGFVDRRLQGDVERLVGGLPAIGGVYVQHLGSGCGASVNADAQFPAASTLKAAMLVDAVRVGRAAQLRSLLDQMIIASQDRAANAVLASIGGGSESAGAASVTGSLQRLGLSRSLVRRGYLLDARRRLPIGTTAQPSLRTNIISTPYELARLMVAIHRGMLGKGGIARLGIAQGPARAEVAARLFRVADRTKLVAGLPSEVQIMHKTGFTTQVKHDVGIVYASSGPIVISGMTWSEGGVSDAVGDGFLAALGRAAYARLSGGGACGR